MRGFVYALVDPRSGDVRYVGKTVLQPQLRLQKHLRYARSPSAQTHVYRWIRSLDAPPELRVLEECDHVDEAERAWISWHRRIGCDLTNLTDGGTGGKVTPSNPEEMRSKVSRFWRGKPKTPEQRRRMRDAALRRVITEADRQAMRDGWARKKVSEVGN